VFPASVDSTHAHQLSITYAHPHSRVRHDSPSSVHSGLLSADDPVTLSRFLDDPRPGFESCALAPSVSSTNSLSNCSSDDARPCLVCERASCNSCPVCEQDFCETHLYRCADCGNRFCGNCLDDHRSDGHWTDSDTVTELNHAQRVYGEQASCSRHHSVNSPWARNQSAGRLTVRATFERLISRLWCMLRLAGLCLSCCSAISRNDVSQCVLLSEVSL
jgi:hypothetical protein